MAAVGPNTAANVGSRQAAAKKGRSQPWHARRPHASHGGGGGAAADAGEADAAGAADAAAAAAEAAVLSKALMRWAATNASMPASCVYCA